MKSLKLTLKAWPAITLLTVGLCFLTGWGAKLLGIDLPDQRNIEVVRRCLAHAFDSWRNFGIVAFLVAQIVVLLPAIEEFVFRWGLFKVPGLVVLRLRAQAIACRVSCGLACVSSALFAAAHYLQQPWPDNAFLALFFFGCAQCWLYRRTDRIWFPMLNHALFNLTNLALLFAFPEP